MNDDWHHCNRDCGLRKGAELGWVWYDRDCTSDGPLDPAWRKVVVASSLFQGESSRVPWCVVEAVGHHMGVGCF